MPVEIIKSQLANIPKTSGVYQFFGADEKVLYVGKAKNLYKRLISYTKIDALIPRIARMVFLAQKLEYIQTQSEVEALLLEHNLIKKLAPRFNILLRDDKTFPYILITKHNFPQITKHRGAKKEQGEYFGPFASGFDVNCTISILRKSFLLRSCSDSEFNSRKKPCLEYQIRRCHAPCVNLISAPEYKKSVQDTIDFLRGKSVAVQNNLAQKMRDLSAKQQYEKAAIIRDRIKALASIQAKQNININEIGDADIITLVTKNNQICIYVSFFRSGNNFGSKPYFYEDDEKNFGDFLSNFLGQFYLNQIPPKQIIINFDLDEKELLEKFLSQISGKKTSIIIPKSGIKYNVIKDQEQIALQVLEQKLIQNLNNQTALIELKNIFNLEEVPKRIEVYDNSHTSGENAVGTLITAGLDGFIKSGYRKFNIRFEELDRDDTAMLREVLRRRFKENNNNIFPDLILIDGGIGQLNAAQKVFTELKINIPFICMSKGENRNAGEEYFHQINKKSFTLPKNHQLMYYLQRLRDEAHRFAITTHRQKRAKSVTKSTLDEISGIGKARKKALLNYFGSLEKIKSATVEDLTRIDGISTELAQKIQDFFSMP
ncbi:MAG: excinuclease ABC subunit UvrC [Rickettsiales bacterium]|nr:excinuclease ABC subunit UvrC [Rickettsiales bacterium]